MCYFTGRKPIKWDRYFSDMLYYYFNKALCCIILVFLSLLS